MFLWISWDFADLPEFLGSATAQNIRSPDLYTWAIEKNGTVRESQGIVGWDNTNVNYVIVILRGWCCDIHSFYSTETSSPHATALGQTMQNIVMATHQESIIFHNSLLKTLDKSLQPLWKPSSNWFQVLVGLKITLVKFTYPLGQTGHVSLCTIILSWPKWRETWWRKVYCLTKEIMG